MRIHFDTIQEMTFFSSINYSTGCLKSHIVDHLTQIAAFVQKNQMALTFFSVGVNVLLIQTAHSVYDLLLSQLQQNAPKTEKLTLSASPGLRWTVVGTSLLAGQYLLFKCLPQLKAQQFLVVASGAAAIGLHLLWHKEASTKKAKMKCQRPLKKGLNVQKEVARVQVGRKQAQQQSPIRIREQVQAKEKQSKQAQEENKVKIAEQVQEDKARLAKQFQEASTTREERDERQIYDLTQSRGKEDWDSFQQEIGQELANIKQDIDELGIA